MSFLKFVFFTIRSLFMLEKLCYLWKILFEELSRQGDIMNELSSRILFIEGCRKLNTDPLFSCNKLLFDFYFSFYHLSIYFIPHDFLIFSHCLFFNFICYIIILNLKILYKDLLSIITRTVVETFIAGIIDSVWTLGVHNR